MWLSKATAAMLVEANREREEAQREIARALGVMSQLATENARLRADMDWFKLRLNQVEKERGQLIQAAIGVKVSVPEFVPAQEPNPAEAFNMPDLSTIGHDALDDSTPATDADPNPGIDFSMMPGYKGR